MKIISHPPQRERIDLMEHSKLPWRVKHLELKHTFIIESEDGRVVELKKFPYWGNAKANADFIEKACNSHYDLVDALKAIIDSGEIPDCYSNPLVLKAKEALKKAGEI